MNEWVVQVIAIQIPCDFFLCSHRIIDSLEEKISALKEDGCTLKEALNRALLDREIQLVSAHLLDC
jgi:hypothetical protein